MLQISCVSWRSEAYRKFRETRSVASGFFLWPDFDEVAEEEAGEFVGGCGVGVAFGGGEIGGEFKEGFAVVGGLGDDVSGLGVAELSGGGEGLAVVAGGDIALVGAVGDGMALVAGEGDFEDGVGLGGIG